MFAQFVSQLLVVAQAHPFEFVGACMFAMAAFGIVLTESNHRSHDR